MSSKVQPGDDSQLQAKVAHIPRRVDIKQHISPTNIQGRDLEAPVQSFSDGARVSDQASSSSSNQRQQATPASSALDLPSDPFLRELCSACDPKSTDIPLLLAQLRELEAKASSHLGRLSHAGAGHTSPSQAHLAAAVAALVATAEATLLPALVGLEQSASKQPTNTISTSIHSSHAGSWLEMSVDGMLSVLEATCRASLSCSLSQVGQVAGTAMELLTLLKSSATVLGIMLEPQAFQVGLSHGRTHVV